MNNIEYGDKLIKLGKMMKSEKTKVKDLVAASLECGLIYTFGLTPIPEASVEIDLNKPDLPYPLSVALLLAKLAVDMEDLAGMLPEIGGDACAKELRDTAVAVNEWSKTLQAEGQL